MKTTCKVIEDLLPLYHDGVCSGESKEAVEEHLKACEGCREELRLLDSSFSAPKPFENEEKAAEAAVKAWKKGKIKSFITGCMIALSLVLFSALSYAGTHFFTTAEADNFDALLSLARISGEDMTFVKSEQKGNYLALLVKNEDDGCDMYVFDRDGVFKNRWSYSGVSYGFSAEMNSWNYGSPQGEAVLIFYGTDLPDGMRRYTFNNSGDVYICPVENNTVLDIFVIPDTNDINAVPIPLNDNMEYLDY